jgi:hypothetical protein
LKKILECLGLGQEGPLNAFFFLLIGVISQRFAMVRKKEGNKHTWRAQYTGELYAAFGKDESLPKRNLLILSQLVGP